VTFKKTPKKLTCGWFFLGFLSGFFLGFFGWVFLGGFFNANPALWQLETPLGTVKRMGKPLENVQRLTDSLWVVFKRHWKAVRKCQNDADNHWLYE
jgi:hypothetical protein